MSKLTPEKRNRLIELEDTIECGVNAVGMALMEIRDSKLYQQDYSSFEVYCEKRWGFTKTYGYRLIEGAKAIKSLPEPQRKDIPTPAAASALASVSPPKRSSVVKTIVDAGKKVTAKAIQSLKPPPRAPKFKPVEDMTGVEVPKEIYKLWNRGREGDLLDAANNVIPAYTYINRILRALELAKKNDDILFVEVGTGMDNLISKVKSIKQEIELTIPYAVCPSCNGVLEVKECTTCKGRGFVSQFYWSTHVPEEIRELRKAAVK